jgi:chemotaxis protein CheD
LTLPPPWPKNGLAAGSAPPSDERHDPAFSNSHFLHAGQVFVSAEAKSIAVILGSCVGVCIWDHASAIGGATHYLLPRWDGRGLPSPRYGDVAVSMLVQKLLEAGADRAHLCAKVFGGGCLFDSLREPSSNGEQHLGSRNVEVALEVLTKARIPVVSTDVGLDRGQRIVFRTDTGDARVNLL